MSKDLSDPYAGGRRPAIEGKALCAYRKAESTSDDTPLCCEAGPLTQADLDALPKREPDPLLSMELPAWVRGAPKRKPFPWAELAFLATVAACACGASIAAVMWLVKYLNGGN